MGAYTTVSATHFNGFALAPVLVYEEQEALIGHQQENDEEKEASM